MKSLADRCRLGKKAKPGLPCSAPKQKWNGNPTPYEKGGFNSKGKKTTG